MGEITFDHSTMTGYLPGAKAVVSINKSASSSDTPAVKSTNPSPPDTGLTRSANWNYWGPNNLFPQDVVALIGKNNVAGQMLQFLIRAIYGKGLMPCRVIIGDDGKEKITLHDDKRVLKFYKENNLKRWYLEQVTDHVHFANTFSEAILNKRRDYICGLYSNDASYCRWENINEKSRLIENCYVSANWPNPSESEYEKVAVADPYDVVNSIRNGTAFKYIIPASLPSPNRSYYQRPVWDAIRENGTIETSNDIVKARRSLFKRQMGWQWHVEIPYEHWEKKFSNITPAPTDEQKKTIITKDLADLDKYLSGEENAGKAFVSHFGTDPVSGKELPGWKITLLDDKMKDGKWLPDASALYSEILFAGGLDPAIMGAGTPGGSFNTAGSGSDKRESYLIKVATLQSDRDVCTEPLYAIHEFNNWPDDCEHRTIDSILTTLDQGSGTKKVVS